MKVDSLVSTRNNHQPLIPTNLELWKEDTEEGKCMTGLWLLE